MHAYKLLQNPKDWLLIYMRPVLTENQVRLHWNSACHGRHPSFHGSGMHMLATWGLGQLADDGRVGLVLLNNSSAVPNAVTIWSFIPFSLTLYSQRSSRLSSYYYSGVHGWAHINRICSTSANGLEEWFAVNERQFRPLASASQSGRRSICSPTCLLTLWWFVG